MCRNAYIMTQRCPFCSIFVLRCFRNLLAGAIVLGSGKCRTSTPQAILQRLSDGHICYIKQLSCSYRGFPYYTLRPTQVSTSTRRCVEHSLSMGDVAPRQRLRPGLPCSAYNIRFLPPHCVGCYRRFSSHASPKTCVMHGLAFVRCGPEYICKAVRIGLVRCRQPLSTALRGNIEPQRRW